MKDQDSNGSDDEQRLDDWLDELEQAHESGHPVQPEDVCQDSRLLADLKASWDRLVRINGWLQAASDTSLPLQDSPADRESPDPTASRAIGPYKLLQEIGEGGMGVVWMAKQSEPIKRRVALKLIRGNFAGKKVIARFEAERQALAMMDHPNIARVLDAGATEAGLPYFVMELVEGIPITKYCDQKRLTVQERLELFIQVCDGIQHAHTKGVIHRDIKPGNVLVTQYDGTPVAKVIDFGIAKAMEAELTDKTLFTEFGQVMGTYLYMSPEQAEMNALAIDTRTDVFALGVLLYELLTGETPITKQTLETQSLAAVLDLIRRLETPKPSQRISTANRKQVADSRNVKLDALISAVRGDLDAVLTKATANERDRRYVTPSDFASDVRRFLAGEPVNAREPSFAYRAKKFVARNKKMVAVVSLALLFLVMGIIGTSSGLIWALIEKEKNEKLAESNGDLAEREQALRAKREHELYISKFRAAYYEYQAGNLLASQTMIANLSSNNNTPELDLLTRNVLGTQLTLAGHKGSVNTVAVSVDGQSIVSGSNDGTLVIWDLKSGRIIRRLKMPKGNINCVNLSEAGSTLIAGGSAGILSVWQLDNDDDDPGLSIQTDLQCINSLAFLSLQNIIVVAGDNVPDKPDLQLLSSKDGSPIESVRTFKMGSVASVQQTDDEHIYCLGDSTQGELDIAAWRVKDGRLADRLDELTPSVNAEVFAVHTSSKRFCVATGHFISLHRADGTSVWSVEAASNTVAIAMSPDGTIIVSGHEDGVVRMWSCEGWGILYAQGELICELKGHTGPVKDIRFTHDGRQFFSASEDGTVKAWNRRHHPHTNPINTYQPLHLTNFAFSRTDDSLLASGAGGIERLEWDLITRERTGNKAYAGNVTPSNGPTSTWLRFRPNASNLNDSTFAHIFDDKIYLCDLNEKDSEIIVGTHVGADSLYWSKDGLLLVSQNSREGLKIWDIHNREFIRECKFDFTHQNQEASSTIESGDNAGLISEDNRFVVSSNSSGMIGIWDIKKDQRTAWIDTSSYGTLSTFDFHQDSGLITTHGSNGGAQLWQSDPWRRTGALVPADFDPRITEAVFSVDGRRVFASRVAGVGIYDRLTGAEMINICPAHAFNLCVSENERWLFFSVSTISNPFDKAAYVTAPVYLTDLSTSQQVSVLGSHSAVITSIDMTTDGLLLVSADTASSIVIWDLRSGEAVCNWRHKDPVTKVTFVGNNAVLVTCEGRHGAKHHTCYTVDGRITSIGDEVEDQIEEHWPWYQFGNKSIASSNDGSLHAKVYGTDILIWRRDSEVDHWQETQEYLSNTEVRYHQDQARVGEVHGNWFAAMFHLDQLLNITSEGAATEIQSRYQQAKSKAGAQRSKNAD